MNTANNRRSQQTNENIVRAVTELSRSKPLAKITVREVCALANINRSTFYAHYMDVFDVMEKVEKTMAKNLTETYLAQIERSLGGAFIALFEFIYEYREFYKIYFNHSGSAGVLQLAPELYRSKIPQDFYKTVGFANEEEFAYQEEFLLAGLTALVRRWLNTGCKESPSRMVEILGHQYNPENQKLLGW